MLLLIAAINLLFSIRLVSASESSAISNEFMADSDQEWVELYVEGDTIDFIKEYWIDDDENFEEDSGTGKKKSLKDISLENKPFLYIEFKSFLNNSGDQVVLFTKEGTIVDRYSYEENPGKDISIGRSPDKTGSFGILSLSTKGSNNAVIATPTPTVTPTSTNTPVPTKTPSPTKVPTVTKVLSPTKTSTPSEVPETEDPYSTPKKSTPTHRQNVSHVLGSSSIRRMEDATNEELISSEPGELEGSNRVIQNIFLVLGGVCMVGMTVSAFIIQRRNT
jgi:hypothetical protein